MDGCELLQIVSFKFVGNDLSFKELVALLLLLSPAIEFFRKIQERKLASLRPQVQLTYQFFIQ